MILVVVNGSTGPANPPPPPQIPDWRAVYSKAMDRSCARDARGSQADIFIEEGQKAPWDDRWRKAWCDGVRAGGGAGILAGFIEQAMDAEYQRRVNPPRPSPEKQASPQQPPKKQKQPHQRRHYEVKPDSIRPLPERLAPFPRITQAQAKTDGAIHLRSSVAVRVDLSPTAKVRYAYLDYRQGRNPYTWIRNDDLEEALRTKTRALEYTLEQLEAKKLLKREARNQGRRIIVQHAPAARLERYYPIPVLVFRDAELTDAAKILYGCLCWHLGERDYCWPGFDALKAELGLKQRALVAAATLLRKLGYIERHRYRSKKLQSNTYILLGFPAKPTQEDARSSADPQEDAHGGAGSCTSSPQDPAPGTCRIMHSAPAESRTTEEIHLGSKTHLNDPTKEAKEEPPANGLADRLVPPDQEKNRMPAAGSADRRSSATKSRQLADQPVSNSDVHVSAGDPTPPDPLTALEDLWHREWRLAFPQWPSPPWHKAERGTCMQLIKEIGPDQTAILLRYVVANWKGYSVRYRLKGLSPSLALAYKLRSTFLPEAFACEQLYQLKAELQEWANAATATASATDPERLPRGELHDRWIEALPLAKQLGFDLSWRSRSDP